MAKSEQIVSYLSIEAWKEALVMSKQAKKEQVIKLRDVGLSFGEIARELGISRSTVSSICQRAKEKHECRCKKCGVLLKQTDGHRKKIFCSDKCRKAWWKLNGKHSVNNKAICLTCGKEFVYHESVLRKYCSLACFYQDRKKEASKK